MFNKVQEEEYACCFTLFLSVCEKAGWGESFFNEMAACLSSTSTG